MCLLLPFSLRHSPCPSRLFFSSSTPLVLTVSSSPPPLLLVFSYSPSILAFSSSSSLLLFLSDFSSSGISPSSPLFTFVSLVFASRRRQHAAASPVAASSTAQTTACAARGCRLFKGQYCFVRLRSQTPAPAPRTHSPKSKDEACILTCTSRLRRGGKG